MGELCRRVDGLDRSDIEMVREACRWQCFGASRMGGVAEGGHDEKEEEGKQARVSWGRFVAWEFLE